MSSHPKPPFTAAQEARVGLQPIETAPRDGTVFLALYRDNGQMAYALTHYRIERDGNEGWWDGNTPSEKAPIHWMPLPPAPGAPC